MTRVFASQFMLFQAELSLWEDCIDLLGDEEESEEEWFDIGGEGEGGRGGDGEVGAKMKMNGGSKDHRTEAALCLLRGRAFEFKENRERATYWYFIFVFFYIFIFNFIFIYVTLFVLLMPSFSLL